MTGAAPSGAAPVSRGGRIHADADLPGRLAAGEADAFEELYESMADRLFGLGYRMLRDRGAAEDAVQHAFLEYVRARPALDDIRSVEAWLFKSLRFTCLDEIRRRTRKPDVPTDELPETPVEAVYLIPDPDLEAALDQLTEEQREVIHLKHVEGYDGAEIAEITGSTRAGVYAMATRAEARLKKLLGPVESGADATSSSEKDQT